MPTFWSIICIFVYNLLNMSIFKCENSEGCVHWNARRSQKGYLYSTLKLEEIVSQFFIRWHPPVLNEKSWKLTDAPQSCHTNSPNQRIAWPSIKYTQEFMFVQDLIKKKLFWLCWLVSVWTKSGSKSSLFFCQKSIKKDEKSKTKGFPVMMTHQ